MPRILVIDDEAGMRSFASRILVRAGHQVAMAENGRSALEAVERGRFDLILTDLLMPEMEGIEFMFELRRRACRIPIIAMSGGGRMQPLNYFRMARHAGASRFLAKPFSVEELLAAVDRLLRPPDSDSSPPGPEASDEAEPASEPASPPPPPLPPLPPAPTSPASGSPGA